MKTVRTFGNLAEAGFASSLLESAGIKTLMADEQSYTLGYGAVSGGLRVQVDDADFERALRVLDEGPDADVSQPREPMPPVGSRIPVGLFVAGFVTLGVLVFAGYQLNENRSRAGFGPVEQTYDSDSNHDGRPDRFATYRNGYAVHSTMDRNFDGKPDEWEFYEGEGNIQRIEEDQNFDGKVDCWFAYKNGQVTSSKSDTDFNGLVDCVGAFENGIPTRADYAPNESGVVTRREILKNGILTEEWVDENRDGIFDYKILFDPFGEKSKPIPIKPGR